MTVLNYDAKAQVGGKLAQIGSRLIGGTAQKMADQFFGKFSELVAPAEEEALAEAAPAAMAPAAERRGLSPVIWILGLVVVVALLLFLFGGGS